MKKSSLSKLFLFGSLSLLFLPFSNLSTAVLKEPEDPEENVPVILDVDVPAPTQCEQDIAANLPVDINWKDVHMLKAPDGTVWQRTIMVRPEGMVTLREGEALVFEGTGQPFSKNKVFIFNNAQDDDGNVPRPDQGTCWEVPEAGDAEGRFEFAIAANTYWDALGEEMIIDSFTQLEQTWDQYADEDTNQNFFIGTRMEPKIVTLVGEPDATEGCTYLCDENPAEEANAHNILLKSVILDITTIEGQDYLLENNFDVLYGDRIAIARYHSNFYGGTAEDVPDAKEYTTQLAMKSMTMEVSKQILLGKIHESLREPSPSPILSLTETSMRNAASGTSSYSTDVEEMAGYVKDMMDNEVSSPIRANAADAIAAEVSAISQSCEPAGNEYVGGAGFNGCIEVDSAMIQQIFPPEPTTGRTAGNDWASDFVTLMEFWTDSVSPNACILPPEAEKTDREIVRYFYDNGNHHGSHRRECGWDLTYSFGFAS